MTKKTNGTPSGRSKNAETIEFAALYISNHLEELSEKYIDPKWSAKITKVIRDLRRISKEMK
jgi:hypothetical protein